MSPSLLSRVTRLTLPLCAMFVSCPQIPAQLSELPPSFAPTRDIYGNMQGGPWDDRFNFLTLSAAGSVPIADLLLADAAPLPLTTTPPKIDPNNFTGIRIVYLGETASRPIDFGFNLGPPSDTNVDGVASSKFGAWTAVTGGQDVENGNLPSLTFWDFNLTAGQFATFDLWINTGDPGTDAGSGLYFAFHPEWDTPDANFGTAKAVWSQEFRQITNSARGATSTPTYILSFEDLRPEDPGLSRDQSDLIFAVQILGKDGWNIPYTVPEPAGFAWLGCASLVLTFAARRRRS